MRLISLLTIILLSSCQNKKETIVSTQEAIKKEIEQVKTSYFQKSDSLESVKKADTSSAKQLEISQELVLAEGQKNSRLIPLQKEYDSLELELRKN